jgi:hypothetical protein
MVVIKLADGRLLVPESALAPHGRVLGDAFVEVGPDDPGYEQLAAEAVSEEEYEERRAAGARGTRSYGSSSWTTWHGMARRAAGTNTADGRPGGGLPVTGRRTQSNWNPRAACAPRFRGTGGDRLGS